MSIIALGFAASAHAQTTDDVYMPHPPRTTIVRMDPLDPISRVAMLAARSNGSTVALPAPMPTSITYFAPPATPAPVAQPVQTVAEEKPAGPSKFFSALNGISAGLQVSHEALDVYEHAIEANALKNYYNGR
jgi:hypothetical protein